MLARLLAGVGATLTRAAGAAGPVAVAAVTATFQQHGRLNHLVRDGLAQQVGGEDDAGRDEGEQQRILDRRNAAVVLPEAAQDASDVHIRIFF